MPICGDHITKIATMPICGENPLKILFSGTEKSGAMKLGMKDKGLGSNEVQANKVK